MRQRNAPQSPSDKCARLLAKALVKGRPPSRTRALDDLIGDGAAAFETLEGLVAHLAVGGGGDAALTQGYLFLLQAQLENLRLQRDRGYDLAIGMLENFQHAVAGHATARRLQGAGLTLVTSALHQAGIPASAELAAVIEATIESAVPPDLGQLAGLIDSIVEAGEGDAFLIIDSLAESSHGLPAAARAGVAAALTTSSNSMAREAAILMLLDPERQIRDAVIAALKNRPTLISPVSVRRLIAMRNWRNEGERAAIDEVVRLARVGGIECAASEPGTQHSVLMSGIDGSGAQTAMIILAAGRRKRPCSILFKRGVRGAWAAPPQTSRSLDAMLAQTTEDIALLTVSRAYLDRIICHEIQVGLDAGELPQAGLLQVQEMLGGTGWQPSRLDWREVLATLLSAVPGARREPAAVAELLRQSVLWAAQFAESWFEDDQEVARQIGLRRMRGAEKQAELVLQTFIEARRDKWAELFCWTALWLREAAPEDDAPWQQFVILADAIAGGCRLDGVSLMRQIAMSTVWVLAEAA